MNNEFEKLDQFMKRNIPSEYSLKRAASIPERGQPLWGIFLSSGLALFLLIGIFITQDQKGEAILELSDVLSMDYSADDFPEELSSLEII